MAKVVLLSGDNPQIPEGEGELVVRAYIAAVPGWKQPLVAYLDELITRSVADVRKAVRWNQPFYAAPNDPGWFAALRCYTSYVQIQFFRGSSLDPPPVREYKHPEVRYFDIHEDDEIDEAGLIRWFQQASRLPGDVL